jgi:hypothetical protein
VQKVPEKINDLPVSFRLEDDGLVGIKVWVTLTGTHDQRVTMVNALHIALQIAVQGALAPLAMHPHTYSVENQVCFMPISPGGIDLMRVWAAIKPKDLTAEQILQALEAAGFVPE